MKTHFNFKEIMVLIDLTKEDLRKVYESVARQKSYSKPVPKDLLVKASLLEEILCKLSIAEARCTMKYKALMDFNKKKKTS